MSAPHTVSVVDRTAFLRVVAVYKFVQTLLLAGLGLATMRMVKPEVAARVSEWVQDQPVGLVQRSAEAFLTWVSGPQSNRLLFLGVGMLLYAALFLVEAVGLWLQKRWAEWLTIVATGALIPPELYECYAHPKPVLFLLLAANVLVVWLLTKRLQHELKQERG